MKKIEKKLEINRSNITLIEWNLMKSDANFFIPTELIEKEKFISESLQEKSLNDLILATK